MNFEQTKLSYRIEKNCITRLPIDKNSLIHEAIRLETLFLSKHILSKAQFDIVNLRYRKLHKRNDELYHTLYESWEQFINYQIRNNPEHIEGVINESNYNSDRI